jgi:GNAT superfamily N-acetyltransferase
VFCAEQAMEIRIGTEADAESDRQVIAYAVFNHSFYDRGFVEMLYVTKSHRRQGVASALMRHLAGLCDTANLFTSTNRSNVAMQRLLLRAGFEPSGVIENLDEGDSELVYVKRLENQAV